MENNNAQKEQELIDSGMWKREILSFSISVIDKTSPYGVRRLTYDIGDDFTSDQIASFEQFFREVNRRFPTVKMFTMGTGLVPVEDDTDKDVQIKLNK